MIICFCNEASAQIQQAWVARYNNGIINGNHQAVKMALDSAGNIYITGFSQNSLSNCGYVTIKYAPNGNQLWAARYDSTNYPSATPAGLVLDNSNNVVVTGNALTIKYDSNGNQLWTAPYSGVSLAADTNADVYVTGMATNFITVKLSPTGSNLWLTTYNEPNGPVWSQVVLVDNSGNVYVAGSDTWGCFSEFPEPPFCYEQLLIVKYDQNGNQLWAKGNNQGGAPVATVQVGGVALDSADNLYLVANFNPEVEEFVFFMYSSGGTPGWTSYPTSALASQPSGLAVDHNHFVLATGQINYQYNGALGTYSYYYGTFKLNTNGSPIWTNRFPQPPVGSSVATAIAVDSADSVYITGYSPGTSSGNDIVTIKYDQSGNQIWLQRYNGSGNGNDAGNAIAVDKNGNVYVTGYETTAAGGTEMVTIKYAPVTLQRRSDGTILLQAQGSPGQSFDVQASTNLQTWQDLGSVTADTNGLAQFDDTNAPNFDWRFYLTVPQ